MGRLEAYKPAIVLVISQFIFAGVALFTRAALVRGLSPRVFVVYRQGIATLIMAPIAFVSRRRSGSSSPSMGLKGFAWIFVASLIGVTFNQNAYFEGLLLANSTVATAATNLIPAITFIMAFVAGWEKINRSGRSVAKILGTVVCVGGAICMALIKGSKLLNGELIPFKSVFSSGDDTWILGCFLLLVSSCFWSLWMILQVPITMNCPDHACSSAWMCLFSTVESATLALLVDHNSEAWILNTPLELGCCLYTGMALAVSFFVQAWCISKRGPLYAAMFNPLCTVIVAIFSGFFLHEEIYIGSVLGASAVIIGVYIVLWCKAKDVEDIRQDRNPKLQSDQTKIVEVLIEEDSLEKGDRKIVDLQKPLLSSNVY